MWLLVLSGWRFYASIPASKHHHAITINVNATSWIDCPEDRP
jgi:hypothetical protein